MDTEKTLALEIMHELKASAKRWFIAFITMIVVEIITVFGFIWYLSLPVEEVQNTQTIQDIEGSDITQTIGDDYGQNRGSDTNNKLQEKSN